MVVVARLALVALCATGCRQLFGIEPVGSGGGGGGGGPAIDARLDGAGDGLIDAPADGAAASGACASSGNTITCGAIDTYISAAHQTTNYGADPSLVLATTSAGDVPLLMFDLSSIASTTSVMNATLTLTATSPPPTGTLELYAVAEAWAEDGATWVDREAGVAWAGGNGPVIGSSPFAMFPPILGANGISITSAVQSWVTSPSTNNGFEINSVDTGMWTFASNDATTASTRPQLVIRTQ